MPLNRTSIIVIIVALLLVGAAGFLLFGEDSRGTGITAEEAGPASEAEQVFINLTNRINPVKLDTAIFTDPRFERLIDIKTDITMEASGRVDPFAPFDGAP